MAIEKERAHQTLSAVDAALPDAFITILEFDARGIDVHTIEIENTDGVDSLDYLIDYALDDVPTGSPTWFTGGIMVATTLAAGVKATEETTLYCTAIRIRAENTTPASVSGIAVRYNGKRHFVLTGEV